MTTQAPKPYKRKKNKELIANEPAATYGIEQTASLKLEVMEEIMELNQTELLHKILEYLKKIKQEHDNGVNAATLQAMLDAKNGDTIRCASFEDYLKAVE